MDSKSYDFSGWASKNDLKCGDGRIIRSNAFSVNDGRKVPLVWNHQHNSVSSVLGHAILENRPEGVYAYCSFNDSKSGQEAKNAVKHGDVTSLSIWANNIKQVGPEVVHGVIREVSLVLAGANPGAYIESVMAHGEAMDEDDTEGIFYTGEDIFILHAEEATPPVKKEKEDKPMAEETGSGKTVKEVFDTLTEEQKKAVALIVGQVIQDQKGGSDVKHNMFDEYDNEDHGVSGYYDDDVYDGDVITHTDIKQILADGKRLGSLRESVAQHMEDGGILSHALTIDTTGMIVSEDKQDYGVNDPNFLFPEYRNLNPTPEFISRDMEWVQVVMSSVSRSPFSRIKSMFANITEDEARARGYIKGKQKKDEVFSLLKRTTDPQTVYKRQKMDRDDVIDITDFDIVAWIRAEMRMMLNEELARAFLIGDGRLNSSEDKISPDHIRPIVSDAPLFTIRTAVDVPAGASRDEIMNTIIDAMILARSDYKGSGTPTLYTTEYYLSRMLLIRDKNDARLYKSVNELATELRVSKIVTVEPMEKATVEIGTDGELPLIGIMVNLTDYRVGADKGGEVNLFDDFDIDYNQMKYLIETRCSGALIKPFSALAFGLKNATAGASTMSTRAAGKTAD